jgi:hypothetical protein
MSPRPDPRPPSDPPPLGPDRRLWMGLAFSGAVIALMALAIHRLAPEPPRAPNAGKAPLNGLTPLMTRPQLLENQQAMPELQDFDAQTPPPIPNDGGGGAPLGTPAPPSDPGTGALGP